MRMQFFGTHKALGLIETNDGPIHSHKFVSKKNIYINNFQPPTINIHKVKLYDLASVDESTIEISTHREYVFSYLI